MSVVSRFFALLRVGKLDGLRRMDVLLSIDPDGDACLQLTLPRPKTDPYNEGHVEVLKGTNSRLCPVTSMARWMGIQPPGDTGGEGLGFKRDLRKSLAHALKLSTVSAGVDFKRIGNHSLRSGVASLMFAVWFEMEIIKRGVGGFPRLSASTFGATSTFSLKY